MANDTNAGLSSYIFSENLKEIMTATERLKFGEVYANVRQKKQSMVITQVGENLALVVQMVFMVLKNITIQL